MKPDGICNGMNRLCDDMKTILVKHSNLRLIDFAIFFT